MIELCGVEVRYRDVIALHPTTLTFRRGEFAVLLGASGAGKSTLLRSINHLTRPTAGRIVIDGLGELADPRVLHDHRKATGMIFQQHKLIGRQSALRNVLMGRLGYHTTLRSLLPLPRDDHRIALDALDRVGLLPKARERVDRLSGGQQQRVGIARAIAQQPRLVLADEPVASLDPATAVKVLSLIKDVCQEQGIAAVVSLHQPELAREFADRVIGIAHGHVVIDAAPADIDDHALTALYENRPRTVLDDVAHPEPRLQPATTH